MPGDFPYDVFLSHSAKDKAVVRDVAERLRKDGLKVWFDEWVLKAGDSIPAKIEEGLEHSRVLVLCMSANAFGSDWAQLESHTFRFKDPLNKARRFIPLRLDDAPIKGFLTQLLYIKWLPVDREQEYAKLLQSCRQLEPWPRPSSNSSEFIKTPNALLQSLERSKSEGERLLAKLPVTFFGHQIWEESALSAVKTAFPNESSKQMFFLSPPERRRTTVYHEALKSNEERDAERAEALKEQLDILASFIRLVNVEQILGQ